jgi:hypothetical protein
MFLTMRNCSLTISLSKQKNQKHLLELYIFKCTLGVQVLSKLKGFKLELRPLALSEAPVRRAFPPAWVCPEQMQHMLLSWNAEQWNIPRKTVLRAARPPLRRQMP